MRTCFSFATALTCLLACQFAAAQWSPGEYMAQSLDECFALADEYQADGFGYAADVSLVGTYMYAGDSYGMTKSLARNQNYVIIAVGDEDALDVDLRVIDSRGEVIAEDIETDPIAILDFNAGRGGECTIEMELYEADAPSYMCFVILEEDGFAMPIGDLQIAMDEMLDMCESANNGANAEGGALQFNDGDNQAVLFGALLEGQESTMLTNLSFGSGEMMAVAAGDSDVEDIDLVLYDTRNRELAADRLVDSYPVINHRTSSRRSYNLEILNAAAADSVPTYCIVGLLQIR